MTWSFPWHFAPRIVTRLRLVFLLIAAVLGLSVAIGLVQMRSLDRNVAHLTQGSVPVLVAARHVESSLKNLLLSLQEASSLQKPDAMPSLQARVDRQLETLSQRILILGGSHGAENVGPDMHDAMVEIIGTAHAALSTRAQVLSQKTSLDQHGQKILDIRAKSLRVLENLAYQNVRRTDSLPVTARPGASVDSDALERAYFETLALATALTELTVQIETVGDLAARLPDVADARALERIQEALRFRMRSITVQIAQLPPTEARTNLAQHVIDLRSLIFGSDGLVNGVKQLQAHRATLAMQEQAQRQPIQRISSRARALTDTAEMDVIAARVNLAQVSDHIMAIMALAALSTMAAIVGASIWVVERQINRRMARLTDSVLTIANGDTTHRTTVTGADELGDMARALDVFRMTAEELSRSNAELEKFAYVAAHDLRSPLRAIQDLAQWTIEDEETRFSQASQRNMRLLQRRITRMNTLLSDLLDYSRIGKEGADLAQIDLVAMVADLGGMLDPEDRFTLTCEATDTPLASYAVPLHHILLNLIGNAIKHHDRARGRITVSAHMHAARLTVRVTDDGPGINPRYHARIFELFKTLRPRDEVEGSGLGLAIIAKLVAHYGGTVQVASDPATKRGSTFTFDLPLAKVVPAPLPVAA